VGDFGEVANHYRVRARNARIRAMRAITKTPLFSQEHQNRDLPYTVE
jgi:hypothetical protein